MKIFLIVILLGLLDSCAPHGTVILPNPDDVKIVPPERELIKSEHALDEVLIKWIRIEHPDKLHDKCVEIGAPLRPGYIALGCSEWDAEKRICTIYAQTPVFVHDDGRMDTLGHELLHCMNGKFHKE